MFSATGDLTGNLVTLHTTIAAAPVLHYVPEIGDSVGSVATGGVAAGVLPLPITAIERGDCGCQH